MAAKKAPAKKMPAKKVASAADFRKKEEADKKKMTPGAGTSKPLKSGEGYLKPQSLAQGANDKRVSKSKGGDLASERGVVRQAAQRNRKFRANQEAAGVDFGLINMTYRDRDGKLVNSVMNRKRFTEFPKKDVLFMGDASKKQPKKKK
jgi:ABC-type hemin transport system ATPase subunit